MSNVRVTLNTRTLKRRCRVVDTKPSKKYRNDDDSDRPHKKTSNDKESDSSHKETPSDDDSDWLDREMEKFAPTKLGRQRRANLLSDTCSSDTCSSDKHASDDPNDPDWSDRFLSQDTDGEDIDWYIEEDIVAEKCNSIKEVMSKLDQGKSLFARIVDSGLSAFEKEMCLGYYVDMLDSDTFTDGFVNKQKLLGYLQHNHHNTIDTERNLEALVSRVQSLAPTLSEIMSSDIEHDDKQKAVEMFMQMMGTTYASQEFFSFAKKIRCLMHTTVLTPDLKRIEDSLKSCDVACNNDAEIKKEILLLDARIDVKKIIYGMYQEMTDSVTSSCRRGEIREKLLFIIRLPFLKIHHPPFDNISAYLTHIRDKIDSSIYGMESVKDEILRAVNDRLSNPGSRFILALKGGPGLGKTKVARVIADAIGVPFARINLGGSTDSTVFKGSNKVWRGAEPGQLLQILKQSRVANPVILLDEIDKISASAKGAEVQASLLHVLDPTQNSEFTDEFLCEFPHDLSRVWFIVSLNQDEILSRYLGDRLRFVHLRSYTPTEMIEIVKRHTWPETLQEKGISKEDLSIQDEAINVLVRGLCHETKDMGMRSVERAVQDIVSKASLLNVCFNSGINPTTHSITYVVPNFSGFPYQITPEAISILRERPMPKEILPYYL